MAGCCFHTTWLWVARGSRPYCDLLFIVDHWIFNLSVCLIWSCFFLAGLCRRWQSLISCCAEMWKSSKQSYSWSNVLHVSRLHYLHANWPHFPQRISLLVNAVHHFLMTSTVTCGAIDFINRVAHYLLAVLNVFSCIYFENVSYLNVKYEICEIQVVLWASYRSRYTEQSQCFAE